MSRLKTRPDTPKVLRLRAQEATRQRRARERRKLREDEERNAAAAEMERQAEAIRRRLNGWSPMRLLRRLRVTFQDGLGFVDLEPGALFWVREGDADNWTRRGDAERLNTGAVASLGARAITRVPDLVETLEWEEPKERLPSGY